MKKLNIEKDDLEYKSKNLYVKDKLWNRFGGASPFSIFNPIINNESRKEQEKISNEIKEKKIDIEKIENKMESLKCNM